MGCGNNKQDISAVYSAPKFQEYKIILVGDSGVGKTAIIESFITGAYKNITWGTTGVKN